MRPRMCPKLIRGPYILITYSISPQKISEGPITRTHEAGRDAYLGIMVRTCEKGFRVQGLGLRIQEPK